MILPFLLAAVTLVLSTGSSIPDAPSERVLKGTDEAEIWIVSKKPRVKVETHQGFTFHIDFATHGALSLANLCADLKTQPKGLTLSFEPTGGILTVDYDKEAKAMRVLFGAEHSPICSVPLPLAVTTTRVLLRQRDQLALYVIPQDGEHVALVWLGSVGNVLVFRNAAQYDLCTNLKISMGKREITAVEFRKGIKMAAMDEIEDLVVTGTNPAGEGFVHRYKFDYEDIRKRADVAYVNFLRAAGNTLLGGEDSKSEATPTPAPAASATPAAAPNPSPAAASPVSTPPIGTESGSTAP